VTNNDLEKIIDIVRTSGKLERLSADEDFYDAGFSSINALQLLMELESAFDITIPDDEFVNARTCTSLHAMVARLTQPT
jgi:acyl carrier protein